MPWRETSAVRERKQFISEWNSGQYNFSALCWKFGISRPTGYKWVRRYEQRGTEGLKDEARVPGHHPNETTRETKEAILALRKRYPTWGPKKLRAWLEQRDPTQLWPAPSTIGDLLKRHGMIPKRRRRARSAEEVSQPFADCDAPNVTWCADFKGDFELGDGSRCYPLTVTDAYSRRILVCSALQGVHHRTAKKAFRLAFEEYGLPDRIRTDNGVPFSSTAPGGLSDLAVWWIRLGITPERIEPGRPQQNGSHERMHRTLKAEATKPPGRHLLWQQFKFNDFMTYFNDERPHEALSQTTPASHYSHSKKRMPKTLSEPNYPDSFETCTTSRTGSLRWRSHVLDFGSVLRQSRIGFELIDDSVWRAWFGPALLGVVSTRRGKLRYSKAPKQVRRSAKSKKPM